MAPLGLRLGASGRALVLQLNDGSGLLERAPRGHAAALGALLGSGRIWISGAPEGWHLDGPALLHLLELVRCGEEVQRAIGTGVDAVEIQLPGGPSRVSLSSAAWVLGKRDPALDRRGGGPRPALARCLGGARRPLGGADPAAQPVPRGARDPLRGRTRPAPSVHPERPRSGPPRGDDDRCGRRGRCVRSGARAACAGCGSSRWRSPRGSPVRVRRRSSASDAGVVLLSDRGMDLLGWDGTARVHRSDPARRGRARRTDARSARPAGSPPGLRATGRRIPAGSSRTTARRWTRVAISAEQVLLFGVERRGMRAVDALTGRERWSFLPARTRRLHLALSGVTVLAASESGCSPGSTSTTARSASGWRRPSPSPGRRSPWGPVVLVPLGREDRSALLALDPVLGEVRWLTELPLRHPAPPTRRGRAGVDRRRSTRTGPPSPASTCGGASSGSARSPVPERPVGVLRAGVELVVVGYHRGRGPGAARRQAGVARGRRGRRRVAR